MIKSLCRGIFYGKNGLYTSSEVQNICKFGSPWWVELVPKHHVAPLVHRDELNAGNELHYVALSRINCNK